MPHPPGKTALEQSHDPNRKDIADLELGLYFSERGISHKLTRRPKPTTAADNEFVVSAETDTEAKIKESIKFAENMPLLSRQGFIDLAAFEYLQDPATAHHYLTNAVAEMGIWKDRGLGGIPRDALPCSPLALRFRVSRENFGAAGGDGEDPDVRVTGAEDGLEALELKSAFSNETTPSERGGDRPDDALTVDDDFDDASSAVSNKRVPGVFIHKVHDPLLKLKKGGSESPSVSSSSLPISADDREKKAEMLVSAYEQARGDIPWVGEKGKSTAEVK